MFRIPFILLAAATTLAVGETLRPLITINCGTDKLPADAKADGIWAIDTKAIAASEIPADSPARSMVFATSQITIPFRGLDEKAGYTLRLTYLSDSATRQQAVYIDGKLAREQFILPDKKILTQDIRVNRDAIQDGAITLAVEQRGGPNAILSAVSLLTDSASGLKPNVSTEYFGNQRFITGTVRDLNSPDFKAPAQSKITATLGGASVSAPVTANGSFSLTLTAEWLKDPKATFTLANSAGGSPITVEVSKLLQPGYRQEILDTSCRDPFELAVAADGRIFYIERLGAVKQVLPASQSSKTLATIPVYSKLDDGLLGLTLDPNFMSNGWLYLYYSDPQNPQNLVSRFTLANDTLTAEKILLRVPANRNIPPCHTGGSLAFDSQGNLFISTGDYVNPFQSAGYAPTDERKGRSDWDAQATSGDTSSLSGKVLRITPQANGTYTIPKGNLFPSRSAQTKPEIFAMGCRNPFRISVDKKNNTLYWGEVGPDSNGPDPSRGPAGHDEVNQAKTAGNFGWPHFAGNNKPYTTYDFTKPSTELRNPAAPENRSPNNKGLSKLPPAQPALIWYPYGSSAEFPALGSGGRCAMAGPVYHFDPKLDSPLKLAANLDNTLFIYDWMRNWIMACKLDANEKITSIERFVPDLQFQRPMDMELGPDGAIYLMEWGSSYGGSNSNARISRLSPGTLLTPAQAKPTEDQQHQALVSKFESALSGGDVSQGREFFNSPKGGCVYCHKSDGAGGVIGPDLSTVASRLSRKQLLESVIFPSLKVDPPYLQLIVTTTDGKTLSGSPTKDDAHHLVLNTPDGKSVTIDKATIKSSVPSPSPMPAGTGESFSPTEMQNLIEYLSRLKQP